MKINRVCLIAVLLFVPGDYSAALGGLNTISDPEAAADPCCASGSMADARKAIDTKDVKHALKWASAHSVREIRDAFELVMKVRALGPETRELADGYFARTVFRTHRRDDFPMPTVLAGFFFMTTVVFGILYFRSKNRIKSLKT